MPRRRNEIRVIVEFAQCVEPVDADAVADEFVHDLETDDVSRWADEVRTAIAGAQHDALEVPDVRDEGRESEAVAVRAQIDALQRQLLKLETTR